MRALWAVKWSIAPPPRDSDASIKSDDEDEVTVDLTYQQDVNEVESLPSEEVSHVPLRNERNSTYEDAENCLQRVFELDPEVSGTESSSPLTSPLSSHDEMNRSSVEDDRSSAFYSPHHHRISVRMQRYLSESDNRSPFAEEPVG